MGELWDLIRPFLPLVLLAIALSGGKKKERNAPLPRTRPQAGPPPRWGPGADPGGAPAAPRPARNPLEDWMEQAREAQRRPDAYDEEEDEDVVYEPAPRVSYEEPGYSPEPVEMRYASAPAKSAHQSRQELADLLADEEMRDPEANVLGSHVNAGKISSGFGREVTDGRAARRFIEHLDEIARTPWERAILMRTVLEPAPGLDPNLPSPSGRRD